MNPRGEDHGSRWGGRALFPQTEKSVNVTRLRNHTENKPTRPRRRPCTHNPRVPNRVLWLLTADLLVLKSNGCAGPGHQHPGPHSLCVQRPGRQVRPPRQDGGGSLEDEAGLVWQQPRRGSLGESGRVWRHELRGESLLGGQAHAGGQGRALGSRVRERLS